jgi:trimeric autotransporter adhesin
VGWQAGLNLTSGSNNTVVGRGAVQSATTAGSETGIGFKALSGVTGNDNTALGAFALVGSTSGGNNTAIGAQAMYNNSTAAPGSDNTALGYEALYNIQSTASQNTTLGDQAGKTITTGSSNTII